MNINTIAGNSAYNFANKLSGASEATGSTGGFSDLISSGINNALNNVKAGEQVSMEAIAGKASLSDVVSAVNSADIALKSVVAIRDKVINAYQDILKMPI
jgi:flagellar hook-basal body complex protein FliE